MGKQSVGCTYRLTTFARHSKMESQMAQFFASLFTSLKPLLISAVGIIAASVVALLNRETFDQ